MLKNKNILISKNDNEITIFNSGSRLIINKNDEKFNELVLLNDDKIIEWYENR